MWRSWRELQVFFWCYLSRCATPLCIGRVLTTSSISQNMTDALFSSKSRLFQKVHSFASFQPCRLEFPNYSGLTMCSSTSNSVLTSNACRSRRLLDYRHFFFRRSNGCCGVVIFKEVAVASQGRYGDPDQRIRIIHHRWSLFECGGHFERDCCAMDIGINSAAEVRSCDSDGGKIHGISYSACANDVAFFETVSLMFCSCNTAWQFGISGAWSRTLQNMQTRSGFNTQ